jgi:hypothetical protein
VEDLFVAFEKNAKVPVARTKLGLDNIIRITGIVISVTDAMAAQAIMLTPLRHALHDVGIYAEEIEMNVWERNEDPVE